MDFRVSLELLTFPSAWDCLSSSSDAPTSLGQISEKSYFIRSVAKFLWVASVLFYLAQQAFGKPKLPGVDFLFFLFDPFFCYRDINS